MGRYIRKRPARGSRVKAKRGWNWGDWTLPGYNYLGPGNKLDKGPPTNNNDAVSLQHDIAYGDYEAKGEDPYTLYNRADAQWLTDADVHDYGGVLGHIAFGAKAGAFQLGLIDGLDVQRPPRLRGSQLVSPSATNMADSTPSGSGNVPGLTETPIDKPRWVERGPPEYTFASLPYVSDTTLYFAPAWAADHGFRMTSPYDPAITQASSVDLNAGAGVVAVYPLSTPDTADTNVASARFYDYYASLYNYYHVIGCRWHMTIENLTMDPIYCHVMYCNDTSPPMAATNEDMMCWKDCESHYIGTHGVAITSTGFREGNEVNANELNVEGSLTAGTTANYETGNHIQARGVGPILKLSGQYRTGDYNREVHLDSEVENWTAVAANPALSERLLFRFRPYWNAISENNASNYGRNIRVKTTFRIDYLVEFKELKSGLRYPIERQPILALISADIDEDDEP